MRLKLALFLLASTTLLANQRYGNFCQQGNKTVVTGGVSGAPKVQGSYPQCQVTVYATGTLNLATIYSDNINTPLANPFTAQTNGWFYFYAANGRYDVTISGGGLPAPATFGDILLADPFSGGGAVTSFNGRTGVVLPATNDYDYRQIQNAPYVVAADYNFTAQTPGGSLTGGGGAQTVTLTPCPAGIVVSGTSATALYISSGTGTAEWLRSSGGTCTSAATTGTIIISPANNHSGAWTVSSAAAGIDLACASSTTGATVLILPGSYNIFGTIRPATGCTIDGLGMPAGNGPSGAVTLHMQTNAIPMFDIVNFATTIKNLQLMFGSFPAYTVGGVVASAGSVCIQSGVTNAIDQPVVEKIICNNFYKNFIFTHGAIYARFLASLAAVNDGFTFGDPVNLLGSGYAEDLIAEHGGGNGFTLLAQAALQWTNIAAFNNQGWGFNATNAGFQVDNIDSEQNFLGEISITTPPSDSWSMQDVVAQACGNTVSFGVNTTAPCVKVAAGNALGVLSNVQILGSQGIGLDIEGNGVNVNGGKMDTCGVGGVAGNTYCMVVQTGASNNITGVTAGGPVLLAGTNNHIFGNYFSNNSGVVPTVAVTNAMNISYCGNTIVNGNGAGPSLVFTGSTGPKCDNYIISGVPSGVLAAANTAFSTTPTVTFAQISGLCNATREGQTFSVTDSSVNTWGTILAGGGANHVYVYCNGTNWTVAGK